jgi:hypothetical protein
MRFLQRFAGRDATRKIREAHPVIGATIFVQIGYIVHGGSPSAGLIAV